MKNSLYERLAYWAEHTPNHPCIVEVETARSITYAECLQAVLEIRQHIGSTPKNIFLMMPGGIVNALLWLSALTGGHTLVPLSSDTVADEARRAMTMFRPDMLFIEQDRQGKAFFPATTTVVTRQECESWLHCHEHNPYAPSTPTSEGYACVMTSGSTGQSKGVVLAEHQIAWTAEQIKTVHQLTQQDRGFTTLPFFHVNAPIVSLCASMLAGSTVMIASHFSRRKFWSWVEHYQPTWISLVPTIVAILLDAEKPASLPPCLRFIRSASAPLPAAHLRAFEAAFGVPLIETYGLSEAASTVAANPLPPENHKPGSVGHPVGVSLRICQPRTTDAHDDLRDVEPGARGEICVRGPNVIQTYYGDVNPTAFHGEWFRTGDLGYLDSDGYLYIVGRLRSVINRGGENIAPRDIEEVLQTFPSVREIAVVGRPDPIYGEQVVAYVTVRDPWTPELARRLHAHAAKHLSAHKVPVEFIALDALPRNRTGKIDSQQLKQREETQTCGIGNFPR